MLDSLRLKLAEVQARTKDYERLRAQLAVCEQALASDATLLAELRSELRQQFKGVLAAPQSRGQGDQASILVMAKQTLVRTAVEGTDKEIAALQSRLAALLQQRAAAKPAPAPPARPATQPSQVAPTHAGPANLSPVLRVIELKAGGATEAAAKSAVTPAAPAKSAEPPAAHAKEPEPYEEHVYEPLAAAEAPAYEDYVSETETPTYVEPAAKAAAAAPSGPEAKLEADLKELDEAVAAGREALESLGRCMELVQEIRRVGVLQSLRAGLFSKGSEHARLTETRRVAHEAQENVHRFMHEAADLKGRFNLRADVGTPKALAEEFMSHLAAEGSAGEPRLMAAMRRTYNEVRALCSGMQLAASRVRARRAAMERRGVHA